MKHLGLIAVLQAVALTWVPSPTPNATTTIYRDGVPIASTLTTASYTDPGVPVGEHTYYAVAALGGTFSAPSNTIAVTVPAQPPALITTSTAAATSNTNANMTKVTVTVTAASGKKVPAGTVTLTATGAAGTLTLTSTLNAKGQVTASIATQLLQVVPLTVSYAGSSTFAPSSTTVP